MTANATATADPSRRSLLGWLLSGATTLLLGVLAYPVLRYVAPPEQAESSADAVVVGQRKDFPIDTGKIVRFGTRPAIVVQTKGGELRAFSAVCTHLGCTVQYRSDLEAIWCACHNGRFDLTGRNIGGPPPRPLDALAVTVRGEDVVLARKV
ncbi:MAG TPA: Rieske (2Fe-2S) protein [Candidatus Binatia bacterium]|nr:Rieske (2Fe-2S) protein [Candidatus Binatia bacterium]